MAASVLEHTIRDERDYAAHVDYVHFNPVKHGLVDEVWVWPYSSFHRAVAMGGYPKGWGGGLSKDDGEGGLGGDMGEFGAR